ncbi:MAG: hypothetical protein V2J51_16960 [Erythrobacter sp.]|jgi:hypothetical protein|nr:hypothetical protein [Erythrobacter sp.]
MAAIEIDVVHAGIPRHASASSDFTRVTDADTRTIILAADRCIVDTAVHLDHDAGWDRVTLETPQRVGAPDGHKACQRAVRLSKHQARIGSLGVDPCNPVGLAFPGPFAIGTALGNPQDFVGIDFMIAKDEALGNRGRTGTAIAWHYAAAARTAASGFLGFWHFVFPLHTKMPHGPDRTCGKKAS